MSHATTSPHRANTSQYVIPGSTVNAGIHEFTMDGIREAMRTLRQSERTDGVSSLFTVDGAAISDLIEYNRREVVAFKSGLSKVDNALGIGLEEDRMYVVGAKSGKGKSLLLSNLADKALNASLDVCDLKLEMSKWQAMTRQLSVSSGTNPWMLRRGRPEYSELAVERAAEKLFSLPGRMHMNGRTINNIRDIETAIRFMATRMGVKVFLVDYIQLVRIDDPRADKYTCATMASQMLFELCHELGLIMIVASQLTKEGSRDDHVPDGTDLLGGSQIWQDADAVLIIDHTSEKDIGSTGRATRLIIDKNRDGSEGAVKVAWDFTTLRMRELLAD